MLGLSAGWDFVAKGSINAYAQDHMWLCRKLATGRHGVHSFRFATRIEWLRDQSDSPRGNDEHLLAWSWLGLGSRRRVTRRCDHRWGACSAVLLRRPGPLLWLWSWTVLSRLRSGSLWTWLRAWTIRTGLRWASAGRRGCLLLTAIQVLRSTEWNFSGQ